MATPSFLLVAQVPTQPLLLLRPQPHTLRRNSLSRLACAATRRRWDSNAETARSRSFGFDFRRRDLNDDDEEEEYDGRNGGEEAEGFFRSSREKKRRWWSDEVDDDGEASGGILEDAIDAFWIFKVFKAYGWLLPFILISWLLASGPKAFLMALAIPLGQSALSLAFDKLWGGTKTRPKRRTRPKRPSKRKTGEQQGEEDEAHEPRKGRSGYQSWAPGNGNGSARRETGFGGWEDLEGEKYARESPSVSADVAAESDVEEGKLSRRRRKSGTPLFLRLLVAVFPFLGSWTKMLW